MIRSMVVLVVLMLGAGCVSVPDVYPEMGDGVNVPKFDASARCPELTPDVSPGEREQICGFVEETWRERLTAPPGARVYREQWFLGCRGKPCSGALVLTVHPDGRRTLKTPWLRGTYTLKPNELADFEQRIARSHFAELPYHVELPVVCVGGAGTSFEAIVDNKYRMVNFSACTGVIDEEIALALDALYILGTRLSGLEHPYWPERPTFRGYPKSD
jgi:hypothetical protein